MKVMQTKMYVVFFPFPWLLHTEMCETCTNYTEPKEQNIYIEKDVWENSSWEFWHWNLKTRAVPIPAIFSEMCHICLTHFLTLRSNFKTQEILIKYQHTLKFWNQINKQIKTS